MCNLLLGRVVWIEAKGWVSFPGDMLPEDATVRIGLIEAEEPVFVSPDRVEMRSAWHPLVIVHDTTDDLIALVTPFEAALWPVATVNAFPGLEEFLLAYVDLHRPRRNYVDWPPDDPLPGSWLVQAGWEASDGFSEGRLSEY